MVPRRPRSRGGKGAGKEEGVGKGKEKVADEDGERRRGQQRVCLEPLFLST